MAQQEALISKTTATNAATDALAHIRTSMQELHKAISDAAAKHGGPTKADLKAVAERMKTATENAKSRMSAQSQASKALLTEAVNLLNSAQKSLSEADKASGHAFQTAVKEIVVNSRAAAQKASEAIAAVRSTASAQQQK